MNLPKIAILMASYNGMSWLPAQINSILNQTGAVVCIYVSDDFSQDGSYEYLRGLSENNPRVKILTNKVKFGSAGRNFYRLIKDVDITGFDYIAFSDQDDIWESDKLIRHVMIAQEQQADGVSSSVMAFWPDGDLKLIVKSQPQRTWDFLFESSGPGCTFLMTPWLVGKVREQLEDNYSRASEVDLHDWLTYAICRANGHKWVIDYRPSVQYRQHQSNVIGANSGLKAKLSRLEKLRKGWYRSEIVKVCQVCAFISNDAQVKKIYSLLMNRTITTQLKLLLYVTQARRKFSDRLILYFLICIFLF